MTSVAAAHQRTIDAITSKIADTVGRVNAAIIANDAKAQFTHKRALASLRDDRKKPSGTPRRSDSSRLRLTVLRSGATA